MKDALFKHVKTQGLYTVIARVKVNPFDVVSMRDMMHVLVRQQPDGWVTGINGEEQKATDFVAIVQAPPERPIVNDVICVMYRGTDGRYWLRSLDEFLDGRFEPMNAQAAAMMPAAYHLGGMRELPNYQPRVGI